MSVIVGFFIEVVLIHLFTPLFRMFLFFFFQAEDGIRDWSVTGVQTCALPISRWQRPSLPTAAARTTESPSVARRRRRPSEAWLGTAWLAPWSFYEPPRDRPRHSRGHPALSAQRPHCRSNPSGRNWPDRPPVVVRGEPPRGRRLQNGVGALVEGGGCLTD